MYLLPASSTKVTAANALRAFRQSEVRDTLYARVQAVEYLIDALPSSLRDAEWRHLCQEFANAYAAFSKVVFLDVAAHHLRNLEFYAAQGGALASTAIGRHPRDVAAYVARIEAEARDFQWASEARAAFALRNRLRHLRTNAAKLLDEGVATFEEAMSLAHLIALATHRKQNPLDIARRICPDLEAYCDKVATEGTPSQRNVLPTRRKTEASQKRTRAYMRDYMRDYRAKKRAARAAPPEPDPLS